MIVSFVTAVNGVLQLFIEITNFLTLFGGVYKCYH